MGPGHSGQSSEVTRHRGTEHQYTAAHCDRETGRLDSALEEKECLRCACVRACVCVCVCVHVSVVDAF